MMNNKTLHLRIKTGLWIIIIGLALSGITAFPLESELAVLKAGLAPNGLMGNWINTIYQAIKTTNTQYPWLSYGTDWLAFAHLMIALVFIGPLRDPIKNIWVIHFGMIACIAIFPLAFIAGAIRGIPFFWRLIDCSFGVIGFIPLYFCNKYIRLLEKGQHNSTI
jgi:hypothetical protein